MGLAPHPIPHRTPHLSHPAFPVSTISPHRTPHLSPRLPHCHHDQTEDDLRDLREKGGVDRGGFECNCGAEMCRGEILGRLFSPPLGAKKAAAAAACAAVGAASSS